MLIISIYNKQKSLEYSLMMITIKNIRTTFKKGGGVSDASKPFEKEIKKYKLFTFRFLFIFIFFIKRKQKKNTSDLG